MSDRPCLTAPTRIALLVGLALWSAAAEGAEQPPWPEEAYNPKPTADDLVLPMPCGGAMVFRPVVVPGIQPFDDQRIVLGSAEETIGFLAGRRTEYLAAAFPDQRDAARKRYFLAKYETSRLQWAAMNGTCSPVDREGLLPATNVSWFEAVQAAQLYSEWLLAKARDLLPQAEGRAAFVRLPTEAEWEFAARGGSAVDATTFAARLFPMPDGQLADYVWHQGASSSNDALQLVGDLKPNPLGLHDIVGNAAEIMFEPFRLNRRGRSHGQAGGFIIRGGDFTIPAEQMRTSWRQEIAFIDPATGRAVRQDRIGFRVSLAAPTLAASSARDEIGTLMAAWQTLPQADPGEELARQENQAMSNLATVARGTGDETLRRQLQTALHDLEAARTERNAARDRMVRTLIHNGAIFAGRVRDEQRRYNAAKTASERAETVVAEIRKQVGAVQWTGNANHIAAALAELTSAENNLAGIVERRDAFRADFDVAVSRYGDMVVELSADHAADTLVQQGRLLQGELRARGQDAFVKPVDVFLRHVAQFRTSGRANPADWTQDIADAIKSKS